MKMRISYALLLGILLCGPGVWGKVGRADYERADALREKVKDLVYKTKIEPHWFDDNRKFWYRNDLRNGKEFILVDCEKGIRQEAFDHEKLAQSLSEQTGNKYTARTLPFTTIRFSEDGKRIEFEIEKPRWTCDLTTYECKPIEEEQTDQNDSERSPRQPRRSEEQQDKSPDGKWEAVFRDHNLFLRSTEDDREFRLSHDGKQGQYYSSAAWSPDAKWIVAYLTKPGTNGMVYLIESSPKEGGRAVFHSHQYDLPGDAMTSYEMSVFSVETKEQIRVDAEPIDFQGPPRLRWARDNRSFTYHKTDRGHQRVRIIRVSAETGKTKTIIDEKSETFINEWWGGVRPTYLDESDEILWPSERDGWMHLYLYDSKEGKLKHQITSGPWVVRQINHIDEPNRTIEFQACGKEPGQDPYFLHYYRIGFDGTGLVCLTPGNGTHRIQYSPDKRVLIDTCSRVDQPPVHELRKTDTGELLCELEKADASALYEIGWRHPEPFVAKGRDGKTDIYGIIHRPMKYNETKKIPIIEQIYAGPHGSFVPKDWNTFYNAQLVSELGFIVVQIDGMGTNHRGKAFHDLCYKNVGDAGFPDRILWIQAAAEKYPYMDTERVGIYGTSAGGQSSTGALLMHSDFYDVAVSSCGCHDNRMDKASWNEQWMGYPAGPHYQEQSNIANAHKLRGHLMLFVGELDRNVPPESTYRLADALIRAGKEFELVVLPGMGHTDGGSYGLRKRRDFFVKHLLGVDPPHWNNQD
ncbi:MAG: prolyl oligopeptidase family serine peptidase [Sedimentisphaerales bacterium]|nr:prolyl oligopeptidase family serine peptidase [Sedimentisphaerales bacterium]